MLEVTIDISCCAAVVWSYTHWKKIGWTATHRNPFALKSFDFWCFEARTFFFHFFFFFFFHTSIRCFQRFSRHKTQNGTTEHKAIRQKQIKKTLWRSKWKCNASKKKSLQSNNIFSLHLMNVKIIWFCLFSNCIISCVLMNRIWTTFKLKSKLIWIWKYNSIYILALYT